MKSFSVSSRGLPAVEVVGANWVVALGLGLEALGHQADIQRLACEVLPNGTVIVREIATGTGFIVQETNPSPTVVAPPQHDEPVGETDPSLFKVRLGVIGQSTTRAQACQTALRIAQEMVPSESGAVLVRDGDFLRFFAATGPHAQELVGLRLPAGVGVVGFSMEQQRTLVLDDASHDGRHCQDVDKLTGYQTRTLACVPVVHDDVCHGAIEVLNLPNNSTFSRRAVHELQAIGAALGACLARLGEE